MRVRIRLLGGFEVSEGERTVAAHAWRLRKAKTLIKLLALEPGHRLHRDQLIARLWPELDLAAARNNMHQVLYSARRALSTIGVDGSAVLVLHDDVVVLGPHGQLVTDLEELEERLERARSCRDTAALTEALRSHWAGLLPEDAYEPWVQDHASRLREWRVGTLLRLVADDPIGLDPQTAVALLAPEIAANPLHEPLHRATMRALDSAGRHAEALVLFERLRSALERELAAEPDAQTRALYRKLLASRARDARALEAPATNLPARVVPLVGRGRELDETARILASTRLLTLTGPGGAGKTALAIELARREAGRYSDGAFLIELGAVFDADLVVEKLAAALRLQLPSRDGPLEAVIGQLRNRQLLIVLDNCEHLIDACAGMVTELLRGCARLTVLATSREPLRIDGEITWRTPSLALPDLRHLPMLEALAAVASVQLFVERAAAASPGFALANNNAAAVAEICYRLEGMPLALELAAACIPALSPQQVAARLGDVLGLLSRGNRARITRQQTLAATLAWSHDLLADKERVLLRRLAVFAGSFTLEAAERVGGGERVLGALARLVDTSLVLAESDANSTRYRLLETVRQYAMGKLQIAGEEAAVRKRHCEWYVEFSEARDPEVATGIVEVAPVSVDLEHDNLRAALTWALEHESAAALRLALALWRYWLARGLFAEGRRWLEAALAAVPRPSARRARALLALAVFDVRAGTARRLADIGAEAIAAAESGMGQTLSLIEDGVLAYMDGRWNDCWQRGVEAQVSGRGAVEVQATSAHMQAMVLLGRGELPAARHAFHEAQRALASVTSQQSFFRTLILGWFVEKPGPSPRLYLEETVLPGPHVSATQARGYVLCNLACLARMAGDTDEARRLVEEAVELFATLGDRDGEALARNHLGCVHRDRADYTASRTALERSLRLRHEIGDRRAIGLTLANLGVLAAAEGDPVRGLALLGQALDGFRETEDAPGRLAARLAMASVHLEGGDDAAARGLLAGTLPESRRTPGNHRATAWGYVMLADVERRLGRVNEAQQAMDQAGMLFRALGSALPWPDRGC
jgi:predicted ATPase/DNA-binding SARP family transcriptional activator